jgi:glycosyltransferase involved in cell wall biosynthesis
VHVDSLDLMEYLPDLPSGVPVVLAHHNVESRLLTRRADAYSGARRWYVRHQAKLVEEAERYWCGRVSLNILVSSIDRAQLLEIAPQAPTLVVPNGVDTKAFSPCSRSPDGGILFIGGHSWFPNADGMSFFAREILPLVRRTLPGVSVRWIGRAPVDVVRDFAAIGIQMLGYVDDIRPEMQKARCTIVPLRVGGGTRLKILDAWALGKAVVSTTLGCEGLDVIHGDNILIADEPADFARAVVRVFEDDALRRTLESGGRETATTTYDWDVLGMELSRSYLALLRSRLLGGSSS